MNRPVPLREPAADYFVREGFYEKVLRQYIKELEEYCNWLEVERLRNRRARKE